MVPCKLELSRRTLSSRAGGVGMFRGSVPDRAVGWRAVECRLGRYRCRRWIWRPNRPHRLCSPAAGVRSLLRLPLPAPRAPYWAFKALAGIKECPLEETARVRVVVSAPQLFPHSQSPTWGPSDSHRLTKDIFHASTRMETGGVFAQLPCIMVFGADVSSSPGFLAQSPGRGEAALWGRGA